MPPKKPRVKAVTDTMGRPVLSKHQPPKIKGMKDTKELDDTQAKEVAAAATLSLPVVKNVPRTENNSAEIPLTQQAVEVSKTVLGNSEADTKNATLKTSLALSREKPMFPSTPDLLAEFRNLQKQVNGYQQKHDMVYRDIVTKLSQLDDIHLLYDQIQGLANRPPVQYVMDSSHHREEIPVPQFGKKRKRPVRHMSSDDDSDTSEDEKRKGKPDKSFLFHPPTRPSGNSAEIRSFGANSKSVLF